MPVAEPTSGPSTPAAWGWGNPVELRFGEGCWRGSGVGRSERRLLLLTTAGSLRRGLPARLAEAWGGAAEFRVSASVTANPEVAALAESARQLAGEGCDGIVALGGGSAIDSGKLLALLLANPTLGLGELLASGVPAAAAPPLPLFAVPTTAGTGSELTPFATLWDAAAGRKHSVASPRMYPAMALVDPELTLGLPREVAVATGLDALSQCLESIWNRNANPLTLGLATAGVRLSLAALPDLAGDRVEAPARAALAQASVCSGLAISQTRTALAHSMSYPLTARLGVPHGLACGFSLPAVLDFNAAVDDGRLRQLAQATGHASVGGLRATLAGLLATLGVGPLLAARGVTRARLLALIPEMLTPGRADNNLRAVDAADLAVILAAAGEVLGA